MAAEAVCFHNKTKASHQFCVICVGQGMIDLIIEIERLLPFRRIGFLTEIELERAVLNEVGGEYRIFHHRIYDGCKR